MRRQEIARRQRKLEREQHLFEARMTELKSEFAARVEEIQRGLVDLQENQSQMAADQQDLGESRRVSRLDESAAQ